MRDFTTTASRVLPHHFDFQRGIVPFHRRQCDYFVHMRSQCRTTRMVRSYIIHQEMTLVTCMTPF